MITTPVPPDSTVTVSGTTATGVGMIVVTDGDRISGGSKALFTKLTICDASTTPSW